MSAKGILHRLFAVGTGTVVGLLISGWMAQRYLPSTQMRLGPWQFEPVPGVPFVYRPNVPGLTNNLGLRTSYDTKVEKRPGCFRVLVVGDSVTESVMRGDPRPSQLFSERLGEKLRAGGRGDVEVLTLAAPGLSLAQELRLLGLRGLPLAPDLIVIAYCYNDPIETDITDKPNVDLSTVNPLVGLWRLAEYQLVQNRVLRWYDGESAVYRKLEQSFRQLSALSLHYRLLLVGMPLLSNDVTQQIHIAPIERLASKYGIPFFNLFPPLAARDLTQFKGDDNIHFNEKGHDAIADILCPVVEPITHGLTGGPPHPPCVSP